MFPLLQNGSLIVTCRKCGRNHVVPTLLGEGGVHHLYSWDTVPAEKKKAHDRFFGILVDDRDVVKKLYWPREDGTGFRVIPELGKDIFWVCDLCEMGYIAAGNVPGAEVVDEYWHYSPDGALVLFSAP